MQRYSKSLEQYRAAAQWTPTGAQTLSKAPERFPFGAFPIFASYGHGARLTDIDGNEYVDFICGLASITLGYNHPSVTAAILQQLNYGINFSLPTILESQVAERICGRFPCGRNGAVRWVKTGSEANEGALRIARRATGRDIIVTVGTGYHSWHSWGASYKAWHPGVPKAMESLVRTFTYNDLTSLEHVLDTSVALVILEPTCHDYTTSEFLYGVIERAHQVGALVCFDEVVCAGRWAIGGGQEYFGVTPDFCTAGKGLANGMPLAGIIGPRHLLDYADLVSGTFGGETLSLAACNAVLDIYEQEPVIETMWRRGRELQQHFNAQCSELNIPAICDGYNCKPRIKFVTGDQATDMLAISLLLQECARNGILLHYGGLNVSYALTDEDMNVTFQALNVALSTVKKAIESREWSSLLGNVIQPVVTVRQ